MYYRLYLLDHSRKIHAGESFLADDDTSAAGLAVAVFSSCSDEFAGYELWKGPVRLAHDRMQLKFAHWHAMNQMQQRDVLELEDRLQRGFECVRKSQRLLEAMAELRTATRSGTPEDGRSGSGDGRPPRRYERPRGRTPITLAR